MREIVKCQYKAVFNNARVSGSTYMYPMILMGRYEDAGETFYVVDATACNKFRNPVEFRTINKPLFEYLREAQHVFGRNSYSRAGVILWITDNPPPRIPNIQWTTTDDSYTVGIRTDKKFKSGYEFSGVHYIE